MPNDTVIKRIQLHHFADASSEAYGTASYVRVTDVHDKVTVAFVFGKSRLAPVKAVSIPRLELKAAVMATNIDEMLRKELKMKIATSVFWSDSMAVLGYIRNRDKKFEVFVANRLSKIHESTTVGQWNHVPTDQNPADDASRGIKSKALQGRWLNGPKFLLKDESEWPSSTECTVTNRCNPTIEASRDCRDAQENDRPSKYPQNENEARKLYRHSRVENIASKHQQD